MTNVISLEEERKKRGLSLPKPFPLIDDGFDDEPVFERGQFWTGDELQFERQRLLNRYFSEQAQSDPGDEDRV